MKIRRIKTRQAGIYTKWFYLPIRDLLSVMRITDNFDEAARRFQPAINADDVKEALVVLEKHGLVQREDTTKRYRAVDRQISTGTRYPPYLVRRYLKAGIDLGKRAVDAFPRDERHISTVTFSMDSGKYQEMLSVLAKARKKIMQLSKNSSTVNMVYQLNTQVFPLVRHRKAIGKADDDCG